MTVTDTDILDFCASIEQQIIEHYHEMGYDRLTSPKVRPDKGGRKYVRIVSGDASSRSVIVFVERETGDIWYPAGWKGPQKNFPRGNLHHDPMEWITECGGCATAR